MTDLKTNFATRLIAWQQAQGRHDLPWQVVDPYAVWVSEIMLQQTQVETVVPYYQRFMASFPDIASLAKAEADLVMTHWAGLGYYSRARNLHASARVVVADHAGCFPKDVEMMRALPGIGRSTAAAIAVFAFGQREAILDGNVKRVLCRVFGVEGWPGESAIEKRLWALAESLLPSSGIRAYTQGLMDLGATLCRRHRPDCGLCPFADDCLAHRHARQAELPARRLRKPLPEKQTTMLVLIHAGEVLLEKRPAPGIWGGLWSLPECGPDVLPADACRRRGLEMEACDELRGFDHTFSHFRLHIRPWRIVVGRPTHLAEPGQLWLDMLNLADAALPSPVRRILQALDSSAEQAVVEA